MSERGERDVLAEWDTLRADERWHNLTADGETYRRIAHALATELRAARAEVNNLRQRYDLDVFGLDAMLNEARAEADAARAERDALRWARDQAIQAWEVTVAENNALRAKMDGGVRGYATKDAHAWVREAEWNRGVPNLRSALLIFTDDTERNDDAM